MDLSTLKLFIEVMRERSFTEVARAGRIAPSSVSRAIAGLEAELGIRLFQRNTRRLVPTEAGLAYVERIAPLVEELEAAGQATAELSERPRGVLRITAPATFGQVGIVPLLPAFTRRYPELDLELLLTDAVLDLLAEHIDLAVRLGNLADSACVATRLGAEPFVVCASPDYLRRQGVPEEPAELAERDCLHLPLAEFAVWRFRRGSGLVEQVRVRGRVLISNTRALQQCALAGMGIALLPRWIVHEALERGDLVALFTDYAVGAGDFEVPIWLLYPSRRYLPLKVRAFIEFIRERYRTGPPWNAPADGQGSAGRAR